MDEERRRNSLGFGDYLDTPIVTAPSTRHRIDGLGNDLGLFDVQLAAHREVVERADRRRFDDVEASQVAAGGAPIARGHALNGNRCSHHFNHERGVRIVEED